MKPYHDLTRQVVLLYAVALLLGIAGWTLPSAAGDSLCAEVKIEIAQELTLERQAFEAHMRINNGLTHLTLEDVSVTVNFADEDGNPVEATSDTDSTSAKFFIRLAPLENLSNFSGGSTQHSIRTVVGRTFQSGKPKRKLRPAHSCRTALHGLTNPARRLMLNREPD